MNKMQELVHFNSPTTDNPCIMEAALEPNIELQNNQNIAKCHISPTGNCYQISCVTISHSFNKKQPNIVETNILF